MLLFPQLFCWGYNGTDRYLHPIMAIMPTFLELQVYSLHESPITEICRLQFQDRIYFL